MAIFPGRKFMADPSVKISNAFQTFMKEAPGHAQAWGGMVQGLASASALDSKTSALAYLAVLAALRMESGIPFHVITAKQQGATREEVISAILVGLPAAGHVVTQALPVALAAFDES
jgi:alkylhydroperoxidase/carboxymuconolactone decarboxylase family protein YurZ